MKCEGMRRYGGMMTLGNPRWEQCRNKAIVMLTVKQDNGEKKTFPSCIECWNEGKETDGIEVIKAEPIKKLKKAKQ